MTSQNPAFSEIETQLFQKWNELFTKWHWKILEFFDDPSSWYRRESRQPFKSTRSSLFGDTLGEVLEHAYPELKSEKSMYREVWVDLYKKDLVNSEDLAPFMSSDYLFRRTSDLGSRFLKFKTSLE